MANDVIAIAAGIAGGLPPLHLPKRRERQPDPVAEAAAIAKRARRAAKRAEDERRTAEGRASYTPPEKLGFERSGWFTGWSVRLAQWDGAPYAMEWPRWRIRSRERRALPGMERPWFMSRKQSDAAWRSNGSQRVRWFMAVAGIDGRHVRNEHSRGAL